MTLRVLIMLVSFLAAAAGWMGSAPLTSRQQLAPVSRQSPAPLRCASPLLMAGEEWTSFDEDALQQYIEMRQSSAISAPMGMKKV